MYSDTDIISFYYIGDDKMNKDNTISGNNIILSEKVTHMFTISFLFTFY